jgi:hypothetical protein
MSEQVALLIAGHFLILAQFVQSFCYCIAPRSSRHQPQGSADMATLANQRGADDQ